MNKIYTKKGDKGETGTFQGRMSKADDLAEVLGSIDELNCWIGVCRGETKSSTEKIDTELKRMQGNLMTAASIFAGKELSFGSYEVRRLERLIDKLTEDLPPLSNFIYPAGYLQVARAVCRKAERRAVAISGLDGKKGREYKKILKYLNRLSDTLFVIGRWTAKKEGRPEEKWKG